MAREISASDGTILSSRSNLAGGEGRSGVSQILAQQAAIAEISQHALGERRLDVLLADTCSMVARILGTELVSVLELSADGRTLTVVAGVGWRPGIVGEWSVPASTGSMSGFSLATGNAIIVEDLAAERRFDVASVLVEHGAVSGISVRIGDPQHPFGAISAFTGRRGRFTRDDTRFLEAVAGVMASAIARLHAEKELRSSRDDLAAILASVSEGITVQDGNGRLLFANDMAARLSGFDSGEEMVAAAAEDILSRYDLFDEDGQPFAASDLPGRVALATGKRPPAALVGFRIRSTGAERWSHVQASPIVGSDGRVSHVVNVFRDVTAERAAEEVQGLIATALGELGSTLDPDEAARRLVEVCVPRLADYAEVDLLEADGGLALAAMEHADADGLERARRHREQHPPVADDETDLVEGLGGGSHLSIELVARRAAIGALKLVRLADRRPFSDADREIARELAGRAAVALENAQLFRAANERRSELETVLGSMAEAVLVFDSRQKLRLSNRAAATILGEVPATLGEFRQRLRDDVAGETPSADELEGEFQLEGTNLWLDVQTYPTVDRFAAGAGRSSIVVVARDVTSNRAAQTTREAFLGVMSHELRTPITTIYGGSELLAHGLDDERRTEVIRDIRAESGRLVRLVEDLLVMTRVERGVLELTDEPLLLQRVLPSVLNALAPSWPQLKVDIAIAERLPAVRGDVTYIEQVVRNLIINAIRYGDALTRGLRVTAEATAEEVLVRVIDNGPGLRGVDPEQLFGLFFRAPSARAVSGGAGIGLFVSRALVEAMGGRTWARENERGGAEFGFSLLTIDAD